MRRVRSGRIPLQQRAGEADRRAEGTSGAARIGGKKLYDRPPFRGEYGRNDFGSIRARHGRAVEPLPREQRIYARRKFYFLYRRESGNVFYDVRRPYGASSFLEIADCEKRRSPSGNRPRLFGRKFLLFRLFDLHTKRGRRPCASALLSRYRRLPAKGIGRLSRRRSARIKKSPSF